MRYPTLQELYDQVVEARAVEAVMGCSCLEDGVICKHVNNWGPLMPTPEHFEKARKALALDEAPIEGLPLCYRLADAALTLINSQPRIPSREEFAEVFGVVLYPYRHARIESLDEAEEAAMPVPQNHWVGGERKPMCSHLFCCGSPSKCERLK